MITEDYVSFETAKLLKEKGFDAEGVSEFGGFYIDYYHTGKNVGIATESMMLNKDLDCWEYLRPTLQMAMKWLREEHNLHIDVDPSEGNWYPTVLDLELEDWTCAIKFGDNIPIRDSYEEACETAIKYCLENLI